MSEVIEVLSAVHGIAPRSEELLRLGIAYEKGRASEEAFEERIDEETEDWLGLQADSGIDIKEDGKLRWQDHLRPIIKASEGFADDIDDAPVTRWYEQNRFYRQPSVRGEIKIDADRFLELTRHQGDHLSLLTPQSFGELCDTGFARPEDDSNIHGAFAGFTNDLYDLGVKRITFIDPTPAGHKRHPVNYEDIRAYAECILECNDVFQDSPPVEINLGYVHPDGVAPQAVWEKNIGLSLSPSFLQYLGSYKGRVSTSVTGSEVWRQLIDTSTTALGLLEPDERELDAIRAFRPARLIVSHTVDFECLPLPYAQEKIKQLAEITAKIREAL